MNSAQRVITLIVSPLCAIVPPSMMKKMPLSCEVTGGSNGVKQTEKCLLPCAQLYTRVASAACLPTSELNENPLNASITFALLTSGRANSKRNITSTLRQPTCCTLHTLITSWRQTFLLRGVAMGFNRDPEVACSP